MIAATNTIEDLFNTRNESAGSPSRIACPICGTGLTLQSSSGVQPVLSPETRDWFNQDLDCFRAFLAFLAYCVNRRNAGVGRRAAVLDPGLSESDAKQWLSEFTCAGESIPDEVVRKLQATGVIDLPLFKQLDEILKALNDREFDEEIDQYVPDLDSIEKSVDAKQFANLVRYILLSIEPSGRFATVAELVLSQEPVQRWASESKTKRPKGMGKLTFLVDQMKAKSPSEYSRLFDFFGKIADTLDDDSAFSQQVVEELKTAGIVGTSTDSLRRDLCNRLERACVIVALLTLHDAKQGLETLDSYFGTSNRARSGRGTYQLPDTAIVSFSLIRMILKSVEVLKFNILDVSDKEKEVLRQLRSSTSDENGGDAHQWLLAQLSEPKTRGLISQLFGFACNGRPSDRIVIKSDSAAGNAEASPKYRRICGWYPKEESTLGVVFVGTPGAGKSFAFYAACAVITSAVSRLGAFTLKPSPMSDASLEALRYAFQRGGKPDRTARNAHHAIEFTLSAQDKNVCVDESLHFVFVDIPGEIAVQPMREGTTDAIVANTLSFSHIIVAFMDLCTDPDFGRRISEGPNAASFSKFILARDLAREPRLDVVANENRLNIAVSDIPQFDFIRRIADQASSRRRKSNGAPPYFMVVVPKADLYGNQDDWNDNKDCLFLHSLFQYLDSSQVLY